MNFIFLFTRYTIYLMLLVASSNSYAHKVNISFYATEPSANEKINIPFTAIVPEVVNRKVNIAFTADYPEIVNKKINISFIATEPIANRKINIAFNAIEQINRKVNLSFVATEPIYRKVNIAFNTTEFTNRKVNINFNAIEQLNRKVNIAFSATDFLNRKIAIPFNADEFYFPTAYAGENVGICLGSSINLSASGGTSYLWSNDSTSTTINVTPLETTAYSLTATANECTDVDEVLVTVNEAKFENTTATICDGDVYEWFGTEYYETGTYPYTISSAAGCDSTITLDLLVDFCTANSNVNLSPKVEVFPNPSTNGIFNIELSKNTKGSVNLNIYDALGQLLDNRKIHSNKYLLDLSKFAIGVYSLEIKTENGNFSKRIVITD